MYPKLCLLKTDTGTFDPPTSSFACPLSKEALVIQVEGLEKEPFLSSAGLWALAFQNFVEVLGGCVAEHVREH